MGVSSSSFIFRIEFSRESETQKVVGGLWTSSCGEQVTETGFSDRRLTPTGVLGSTHVSGRVHPAGIASIAVCGSLQCARFTKGVSCSVFPSTSSGFAYCSVYRLNVALSMRVCEYASVFFRRTRCGARAMWPCRGVSKVDKGMLSLKPSGCFVCECLCVTVGVRNDRQNTWRKEKEPKSFPVLGSCRSLHK